jgi:hypothetical protein
VRADGASDPRSWIRAVKHDQGALELRADDEADSRRQKSKAYCFPARGQLRVIGKRDSADGKQRPFVARKRRS